MGEPLLGTGVWPSTPPPRSWFPLPRASYPSPHLTLAEGGPPFWLLRTAEPEGTPACLACGECLSWALCRLHCVQVLPLWLPRLPTLGVRTPDQRVSLLWPHAKGSGTGGETGRPPPGEQWRTGAGAWGEAEVGDRGTLPFEPRIQLGLSSLGAHTACGPSEDFASRCSPCPTPLDLGQGRRLAYGGVQRKNGGNRWV